MQNIDFGRIYRKSHQVPLREQNRESDRPSSRITVFISLAVVIFIAGIAIGMQYQKAVITEQIENDVVQGGRETSTPEIKVSNVASNSVNNKEAGNQPSGSIIHTKNKNRQTTVDVASIKKLDKDTYIIGKSFRDKKLAYKVGLGLKKKGMPVFASQNGSKMNLYIGPIKGRRAANRLFAQAKRYPGYNGAILYKK